MASVFVTSQWPGKALQTLTGIGHAVEVWPHFEPPSRSELIRRARSVDVLITTVADPVDAGVLDAGAGVLKIVAQAGTGVDNIDLDAAERNGICVTNAPGVLAEATADLAFALLIAVVRRVPEAASYVKAGEWTTWHPALLLGREMRGATVGVVGLGQIGAAFARRCEGFGMSILYTSRSPKTIGDDRGYAYQSTADLLKRSDFVSLHVPLSEETRRLINRERLRVMKRDAILINTARGAIVDTDALVDALREGHLAGAGLDVTDPEPLPATHPLLKLSNVVVLPHIGSASFQTRARMLELAVQNAAAFLRGDTPAHTVTPTNNT